MKLHTLAPVMLSGALLAPTAQADHKTGFDFQFDFGIKSLDEDETIEGDQTSYGFSQRRARWWLGGELMEKFTYKFRYDFNQKGVETSYVKAGYKFADNMELTFGTGFEPIPLGSVVTNSYRMSDAVVDNNAADAMFKGDLGVQLAVDVGVGEVKVGLANGKEISKAGVNTSLSSLGFGAAFEGKFGMFSPYVGFGFMNAPEEKPKAAGGTTFKGRSDMDLSVGAGVDLGATDLFFNFATHQEGEMKTETGGVEAIAAPKTEIQGFEFKATQAISEKLEAGLHFSQDSYSSDGKNSQDIQQIGAQLFLYPYGNDKAYFTFSLANATTKPNKGKESSVLDAIFTFSLKPSWEIGHHHD